MGKYYSGRESAGLSEYIRTKGVRYRLEFKEPPQNKVSVERYYYGFEKLVAIFSKYMEEVTKTNVNGKTEYGIEELKQMLQDPNNNRSKIEIAVSQIQTEA